MYLEHFGLTEAPFRITPHTDFFFSGGNRGATLDALLYAITHDEGIVKVSGEVGSGKTMLCRVLMERLPERVTIVYLANPSLSREDILYAIADELRLTVPPDARASFVLRALQEHLIQSHASGRQVVALIDEAHAMPAETLEEIRLLSNLESNRHKLLQIVLFGQPELNELLSKPDMRQLKERITHNFTLEPLVQSDIGSYIDFRIRAAGYRGPPLFDPIALKAIAKTSQGLSRRINILADKCLLAAFANGSYLIGRNEVDAAIKDCDFSDSPFAPTANDLLKTKVPLSVLALGILFGGLLTTAFFYLQQMSNATDSPTTALAYSISAPIHSPTPTPTTVIEPAVTQTLPAPTDAAAPLSAISSADVMTSQTHTSLPPSSAQPTTLPTSPPASENLSAPVENKKVVEIPPATTLPPNSGPLTRELIVSGGKWLAQANSNAWFLQLMSSDMSQPSAVESFIQNAINGGLDAEKLRAYYIDTAQMKRLGVIYGEFPTRADALAYLKEIPNATKGSKPYPRQIGQLR
jgi:MSHA biogenesis protein MshM